MSGKETPIGTMRIGKDLCAYVKTKNSWKKAKRDFPEAYNAIKLFKAHGNFKELIDNKNPKFLKGQLSPDELIQGARINILPNGEKLDKAYSIFAKNLTFHDESSHDHWDVIYQNPNGQFAYVYSLKKRKSAIKNKYKKVKLFEEKYPQLQRKVLKALEDREDIYAVPMYTLLKTYMRVGNELHYKENGHKGLTTLKKRDISINGSTVHFNYLAKSGVPMKITQEFPHIYVQRLKEMMSHANQSDFIFTNSQKIPLKDTAFMDAFEDYCGEKFYPHIVRSYYATKKAEEFLACHKQATKADLKELFTSVAEKLGHKRFDKKQNEWKSSYNVTIHHYLNPEVLEKLNELTTKNK